MEIAGRTDPDVCEAILAIVAGNRKSAGAIATRQGQPAHGTGCLHSGQYLQPLYYLLVKGILSGWVGRRSEANAEYQLVFGIEARIDVHEPYKALD